MKKENIDQEKTTIINLYLPRFGPPNFMKQIPLDKNVQTDTNIIIVSGLSILLSPIYMSYRQKNQQRKTDV
jgi:hypothetical protein